MCQLLSAHLFTFLPFPPNEFHLKWKRELPLIPLTRKCHFARVNKFQNVSSSEFFSKGPFYPFFFGPGCGQKLLLVVIEQTQTTQLIEEAFTCPSSRPSFLSSILPGSWITHLLLMTQLMYHITDSLAFSASKLKFGPCNCCRVPGWL